MEYEDRRDADDAYHEMHNKRMGRDDTLKIEVSFHPAFLERVVLLTQFSGLAHHHLLLGALSAVAVRIGIVVVVAALLVAGRRVPAAALATTPRARMIAATATVTTIVNAVILAIGLAALTLGKWYRKSRYPKQILIQT